METTQQTIPENLKKQMKTTIIYQMNKLKDSLEDENYHDLHFVQRFDVLLRLLNTNPQSVIIAAKRVYNFRVFTNFSDIKQDAKQLYNQLTFYVNWIFNTNEPLLR